jgi:hypothetical protein
MNLSRFEERPQEESKVTNENEEVKEENKDGENKDKKARRQLQPRFKFRVDDLTHKRNGLRLFYEATKNMKSINKPDAKEVNIF